MPAWCGQTLIISGLLAAVVALACRVGRFSPATRHALWLLVLIKLLTPPVISYPATWPGLKIALAFPQTAASVSRPRSESVAFQAENPAVSPAGELAIAPESTAADADLRALPEAEQMEVASTPVASITDYWRPLEQILACVWVSGAAVFLVIQLERIRRFRRLLVDPLVNATLEAQIRELARGMGVAAPRLLVVRATVSPMIWGWGRPKLIWPLELGEHLSPAARRRSALVHELAHLARRDHWVGWLELAAGCVWWWNPLYWYVRFQLHENSELACDSWVTAKLPQDRRAYAEALIEVSQLVSVATAPIAAVGMSRSGRHTFERRLTMIMRQRVPHRLTIAKTLGIGLLGLAVLPGLSDGQVIPAPPTPAAVPATAAAPTPAPTPATAAPAATLAPSAGSPAATPAPATPLGIPGVAPSVEQPAPAIGGPPSKPEVTSNPPTPSTGNVPLLKSRTAEQQSSPPSGLPPTLSPKSTHANLIRQNQQRIQELSKEIAKLKNADADQAAKNGGAYIRRNEAQISELCRQVEVLQKIDADVAANNGGAGPSTTPHANRPVPANKPLAAIIGFLNPQPSTPEAPAGVPSVTFTATPDLPGADHVRVLTRATYKLPQGKAAAFIAFLNEMLPDEVESKENGDSVTITASNETQAVIARFISLLTQNRTSNKTSSTEGNSLPRAAAYLAPVPGATLPTAASK